MSLQPAGSVLGGSSKQPVDDWWQEILDLHAACERDDTVYLRKLLANGVDKETRAMSRNPLMTAAECGSTGCVRELLAAGADKESKNDNGLTPLILAAQHGHAQIVGELLAAGAEKEAKDKDGWTPLMRASLRGHAKVVKVFLLVGAAKEAKCDLGWTPLMIAARYGHAEVVGALLAERAEKEAKDKDGWTPLMVAARYGHAEVVGALLAAGAEKEARDYRGQTPLMWAASERHAAVVGALLAAGAEKEAKDKDGPTALMRAAKEDHVEVVGALLAAGAEKEAKDKDGQTPLMWAAAEGHAAVVGALLAAGAEKEAKDKHGQTSLMCGARARSVGVVRALLAAGAEKDAEDKNGWTPLMWAATEGHAEVVGALLAAGAEKEAKDNEGRTALDFARSHDECRRLLSEEVHYWLLFDTSGAAAGERWQQLRSGHAAFRAQLRRSPKADHTTAAIRLLGESVEVYQVLGTDRIAARDLPELPDAPPSAPSACSRKRALPLVKALPKGSSSGNPAAGAPEVMLLMLGAPFDVRNAVRELKQMRYLALVVGIALGDTGMTSLREMQRRLEGSDIRCWIKATHSEQALIQALQDAAADGEVVREKHGQGAKYTLTISWPSGATAASLERAKRESVKDVMTAVKRQVVVDKGCQLRLLLHEAVLDDAADLRDLPLSTPLTVVAEALDASDLPAGMKTRVEEQTAALCQLCDDLPAHLTAALEDSPVHFLENIILKLPADQLAILTNDADAAKEILTGVREDQVPALLADPAAFLGPALEEQMVLQAQLAEAAAQQPSLQGRAVASAETEPAEGRAREEDERSRPLAGPARSALRGTGKEADTWRGVQAAGPTEGLVIQLCWGDFAEFRNGVLMVVPRSLHVRLSPGFDIVREEPPTPLPEGVVPLSPIVDLFPHNTAFGGQRFMVVLPTCSGADKAWRSLPEGGWEELTEVEFFGGHAALRLDHFCQIFLGTQRPEPRRLKVRGFLSRTQRAAKCALVHSNCPACEQELRQDCCQDPDELAGFDECTPVKLAGLYQHGQELDLCHRNRQEWSERVKLRFDCFPHVTSTAMCVHEPLFEVSIDDDPHTFRLPDAPPATSQMQNQTGTSASSSTVNASVETGQLARTEPAQPPQTRSPQPDTSAAASSSDDPHRGGVEDAPAAQPLYVSGPPGTRVLVQARPPASAPPLLQVLAEVGLPDVGLEEPSGSTSSTAPAPVGGEPEHQHMTPLRQIRSFAARVFIANFNSIRERFGGRSVGHTVVVQAPQEEHTSGYTPGPSAALSTPRQPAQRRHLLISGRFNSQEKLGYMRSVKRVLDSEGVPVYMVQTRGPGDSFGNLTELGLYRALGLIAFCTDDYGAVTGAQYETFVELRYAHQNKLPIIPVQLCDTFPPEPPDEEGRAQNHLVLRRDIDRIVDLEMGEPERVARKILRAWNGLQEPPRPG